MLKSKSILAPIEKEDGIRISTMSRHTLNDGKTPDPRITKDIFERHDIKLAPPSKIVGAYYRKEIDFDSYKEEYTNYLKNISKYITETLIYPALKENITVLCIEDTPTYCHRKLLVEFSKELADSLNLLLEIKIK